jgi:hypothetical protein
MSFQAYLDNIQAETGKKPADFEKLEEERCFTGSGRESWTSRGLAKERLCLGVRTRDARCAVLEPSIQAKNIRRST